VKTVSRFETRSVPGEIRIPSAMLELLKDELGSGPRGTILVKGKMVSALRRHRANRPDTRLKRRYGWRFG
jgi:hypothetical protein